jgi:hypothetical protein
MREAATKNKKIIRHSFLCACTLPCLCVQLLGIDASMADPEEARFVMQRLVHKCAAMVEDIRKVVALADPDGSGEDWSTLQAQEVRTRVHLPAVHQRCGSHRPRSSVCLICSFLLPSLRPLTRRLQPVRLTMLLQAISGSCRLTTRVLVRHTVSQEEGRVLVVGEAALLVTIAQPTENSSRMRRRVEEGCFLALRLLMLTMTKRCWTEQS